MCVLVSMSTGGISGGRLVYVCIIIVMCFKIRLWVQQRSIIDSGGTAHQPRRRLCVVVRQLWLEVGLGVGFGAPIESIVFVFLVCRKTSVVVHSGGGGGSWGCGLGVRLGAPIESIVCVVLVYRKTSIVVHSGGGGGSCGYSLGVGLGGSVQNIVRVIILTRKSGVVIHSSSSGGWGCGLGKGTSCGIVIVLLGQLVWLGVGLGGSVQNIVRVFIHTRKPGVVIHSSGGGGWGCGLGRGASGSILVLGLLVRWRVVGVGLGVGLGGSIQNIVRAIIFTRKTSVVIHSGGAGGWSHSGWVYGLGMGVSGRIIIVVLGLLVLLGLWVWVGLGGSVLSIVCVFPFSRQPGVVVHGRSVGGWKYSGWGRGLERRASGSIVIVVLWLLVL